MLMTPQNVMSGLKSLRRVPERELSYLAMYVYRSHRRVLLLTRMLKIMFDHVRIRRMVLLYRILSVLL